jgi:hypothetical protein
LPEDEVLADANFYFGCKACYWMKISAGNICHNKNGMVSLFACILVDLS